MNTHFLGAALGSPLTPSIPERPHKILLLGIHRNRWLAELLEPLRAPLMCSRTGHRGPGGPATLERLPVALQAVAPFVEQNPSYGARAHRCPWRVYSRASSVVLLQVQCNADSGSPRVVGSTTLDLIKQLWSVSVRRLRPAPVRRKAGSTGASGFSSCCASSANPLLTVLGYMPGVGAHRAHAAPPISAPLSAGLPPTHALIHQHAERSVLQLHRALHQITA